MASEKVYRSVHGIVQFDPRDGEAAGKQVRNIVVNQVGFGPYAVRVSATLWPDFDHVKVERGDVVTLEGSYTSSTKTKDNGEKVTYHNISVSKIKNFGPADTGTPVETTSDDEDVDDEDAPF